MILEFYECNRNAELMAGSKLKVADMNRNTKAHRFFFGVSVFVVGRPLQ